MFITFVAIAQDTDFFVQQLVLQAQSTPAQLDSLTSNQIIDQKFFT